MTRGAPASTVSDAVELTPLFVAVIVGSPPPAAEQTLPLQDPSGAIEKLVPAVTSPSEFPPASKPCAVYDCEPPDAIVAVAGDTTMWSSAARGDAVNDAVPLFPPFVPVTVCGPAFVAEHVAPEHEPSGAIENVVPAVTSPNTFSY